MTTSVEFSPQTLHEHFQHSNELVVRGSGEVSCLFSDLDYEELRKSSAFFFESVLANTEETAKRSLLHGIKTVVDQMIRPLGKVLGDIVPIRSVSYYQTKEGQGCLEISSRKHLRITTLSMQIPLGLSTLSESYRGMVITSSCDLIRMLLQRANQTLVLQKNQTLCLRDIKAAPLISACETPQFNCSFIIPEEQGHNLHFIAKELTIGTEPFANEALTMTSTASTLVITLRSLMKGHRSLP